VSRTDIISGSGFGGHVSLSMWVSLNPSRANITSAGVTF
jgi:hypothetical protein